MKTRSRVVALMVVSGLASGASGVTSAEVAERIMSMREEVGAPEGQPAVEVGPPQGQPAAEATPNAVTTAQPLTPAEPTAPPPGPKSFWDGWKRSLEAGLTVASGNTENFGARVAFKTERDVETMKTVFSADYTYKTEDSDKTESQGNLEARNDWKFGEDNRWRYFIKGKLEYDEFQDWDWRISAHTGFGYELIKTDKTLFVPRIGVGFSREIGGSSNEIVPEGLLGWDFEHKFNEHTKLFNTFDFYPSLADFGQYRFETKLGLEVLMNEENGLALRLGLEDKYDSTPEGQERNDLTYFATVVWNF